MNSTHRSRICRLSGVAGAALLVAAALFLVPSATAQQDSPDARAVRLSYVEGQVQLSNDGTVLASEALANTPLFQGTRITTGDDGRAEVQFEDGSVARISPNSSLTLSTLNQQGNDTRTILDLTSGLGYFELQDASSADSMRIRFGNSVATATGFTVLRVDVDDPPGEFAVFSGNAHLESAGTTAIDLHGGESVRLNAEDPSNYQLSQTIEPNSWDTWNSDRDQALTSQEASRTTATNTQPDSSNPAWGDLDSNGNWYNVPGQGYVWSPYEAASLNWDPYGCGNWMWMPAYGYVWVSCEPWGYLPFQYGMWNYYGGFGWGWSPGYGGTWWGSGGWTSNVGAKPIDYAPPNRPKGGPIHPGGRPLVRVTGGHFRPYPLIPVNRLRESGGVAGRPIRVHNAPARIGGHTVTPLRPIEPRPRYEHLPPAGISRPVYSYGAGTAFQHSESGTRPIYGGTAIHSRNGYVPRANGTPVRPTSRYGYNPSPSAFGGSRATGRPSFGNRGASPNFGGARPSHPSPSFGGGGRPSFGGGARPSFGGGGGGGGGGFHPSGGGFHPSGGAAHPSAPRH